MTKAAFINRNNLSLAWGEALLSAVDSGVEELIPLVVTVDGFDNVPQEIPEIRNSLDELLGRSNKMLVDTTAKTIFPYSMWNTDQSRQQLYDRYASILPRLKHMCKPNRYGTYFGRLTTDGPEGINQLEFLFDIFNKGNRRRSAYVASIFDPQKDLTNQRQRGFPCLQQVTFTRFGKQQDELMITGFYPMQYLFDRAYGNYLGLCGLGHFVAHNMGLRFTKMVCMVGIAKIGSASKGRLKDISEIIKDQIKVCDETINQ